MDRPSLLLKKNEDRRLSAGHLWVFSNEVDTARTPLTAFQPGDQALVVSHRGKPLGVAYVNPGSLICARICDKNPSARLDRAWLRRRLSRALTLRQRLFTEPYYRLVYGEGDHLPGLVADRYGDLLAVQILTAGMERLRGDILDVLDELVGPKTVLLRGDARPRQLEGLPLEVETAKGELPERIEVPEGPGRYLAPCAAGQKTGWFYDQRPNRLRLLPLVKGLTVLDVYSYVGALGVGAALSGAAEAVCLDSSRTAVEHVEENARQNGVADRVRAVRADAEEAMEAMIQEGRRFDVVSLDPPAFVKRKKDLETALGAYHKVNRLAARLLAPDGLVLTASCSQHLPAGEFQRLTFKSFSGPRRPQLLIRGGQGPDHPIHPAMPETDYLKSLLYRVVTPGAGDSSPPDENA